MSGHHGYRILEMIPGFFICVTFAAMAALVFWQPAAALYVVVLFDLYWLFRMYYLLVHILVTWRSYRAALHGDWISRLSAAYPLVWRNYWHVVILPTCGEPYAVVERTLQQLVAVRYPKDRMLVVLAGEARRGAHFQPIADRATRDFGGRFAHFLVTVHPDGQAGEIAGKGSNLRYAGKSVQRLIDQLQLPYAQVIVSSFDVDTRPHLQYFGLLTLTYLGQARPTHASYQPIASYTNNAWSSNPIVRAVAGTTTFWLMTDMARPERLFTFSSHSMSFATLAAVNFWDAQVVTEDSRIFLQCLAHFRGDYRVVPVPLPVEMNTVDVGRWGKSLLNQYRQIRRWAWSVEHFPWMAVHFWGRQRGPGFTGSRQWRYFWNLSEGLYSWATAPVLIFGFSRWALFWADRTAAAGAVSERVAGLLALFANAGLLGLAVFGGLYLSMLPPAPRGRRISATLSALLQWLLMPFTLVLFGAVPAMEAQLRLLLGGRFRIGFEVTEKT